jgi:hypothetical protein
LAPLHLSLPQTYATRKNKKNKNKINMNEEHEVPWYPYTFHYHKTKTSWKLFAHCHKNKKTRSMIKAPHCPTSCIITKGKQKMSIKLKPPYPLCYHKKPNIKPIKTNKQI